MYRLQARIVEPHIFGYDSKGKLVLSAFQRQGGSGIGFRTFFVDDLSGIEVRSEHFSASPEYNALDPYVEIVICRV